MRWGATVRANAAFGSWRKSVDALELLAAAIHCDGGPPQTGPVYWQLLPAQEKLQHTHDELRLHSPPGGTQPAGRHVVPKVWVAQFTLQHSVLLVHSCSVPNPSTLQQRPPSQR